MKAGKKLIIVFITILGIDISFMHAIKNAPQQKLPSGFWGSSNTYLFPILIITLNTPNIERLII